MFLSNLIPLERISTARNFGLCIAESQNGGQFQNEASNPLNSIRRSTEFPLNIASYMPSFMPSSIPFVNDFIKQQPQSHSQPYVNSGQHPSQISHSTSLPTNYSPSTPQNLQTQNPFQTQSLRSPYTQQIPQSSHFPQSSQTYQPTGSMFPSPTSQFSRPSSLYNNRNMLPLYDQNTPSYPRNFQHTTRTDPQDMQQYNQNPNLPDYEQRPNPKFMNFPQQNYQDYSQNGMPSDNSRQNPYHLQNFMPSDNLGLRPNIPVTINRRYSNEHSPYLPQVDSSSSRGNYYPQNMPPRFYNSPMSNQNAFDSVRSGPSPYSSATSYTYTSNNNEPPKERFVSIHNSPDFDKPKIITYSSPDNSNMKPEMLDTKSQKPVSSSKDSITNPNHSPPIGSGNGIPSNEYVSIPDYNEENSATVPNGKSNLMKENLVMPENVPVQMSRQLSNSEPVNFPSEVEHSPGNEHLVTPFMEQPGQTNAQNPSENLSNASPSQPQFLPPNSEALNSNYIQKELIQNHTQLPLGSSNKQPMIEQKASGPMSGQQKPSPVSGQQKPSPMCGQQKSSPKSGQQISSPMNEKPLSQQSNLPTQLNQISPNLDYPPTGILSIPSNNNAYVPKGKLSIDDLFSATAQPSNPNEVLQTSIRGDLGIAMVQNMLTSLSSTTKMPLHVVTTLLKSIATQLPNAELYDQLRLTLVVANGAVRGLEEILIANQNTQPQKLARRSIELSESPTTNNENYRSSNSLDTTPAMHKAASANNLVIQTVLSNPLQDQSKQISTLITTDLLSGVDDSLLHNTNLRKNGKFVFNADEVPVNLDDFPPLPKQIEGRVRSTILNNAPIGIPAQKIDQLMEEILKDLRYELAPQLMYLYNTDYISSK